MASLNSPAPNKERVGYRPGHVWRRWGAAGLEKFAAAGAACGGRAGSIGADLGTRDQGAAGLHGPAAPTMQNQALSRVRSWRVAWLKLQGLGKVAVFCGFEACRLVMASFATGARSIDQAPPASDPGRIDRGGWFPLSPPAQPPFPGRAGQTQDLEKAGPSLPLRLWLHLTGLAGGAENSDARCGVRGRGAIGPKGSGGANRAAVIGSVNRMRFLGHFRLDRGKAAKLGGVRA